MPFWFTIWDGENDEHVCQHGVTQDEFEEVVADPASSVVPGRFPGRFEVRGETASGKRLVCVYDLLDDTTIYPVTAFEVDE